jgi:hypothetical protein
MQLRISMSEKLTHLEEIEKELEDKTIEVHNLTVI